MPSDTCIHFCTLLAISPDSWTEFFYQCRCHMTHSLNFSTSVGVLIRGVRVQLFYLRTSSIEFDQNSNEFEFDSSLFSFVTN